MTRQAALVLEFAGYAFERDQGLRRRGEAVGLPPKVAAAFALLVDRRRALVTREELVAAVWGKAGASDDSIARCLHQLRQLVPLPDRRPLIRTVHGSGFRLAVPVRERRAGASTTAHKLVGGAATAEPFEMLQQTRELLGLMMAPEIDAALVAVERINVRWPEYAPAWSFRADLHMLRAMRWFGAPRDNGVAARSAAEHALALDPEYAPVWAVRGVVDALIERDTAGGLADLERAIALDRGYFMARGYHARGAARARGAAAAGGHVGGAVGACAGARCARAARRGDGVGGARLRARRPVRRADAPRPAARCVALAEAAKTGVRSVTKAEFAFVTDLTPLTASSSGSH